MLSASEIDVIGNLFSTGWGQPTTEPAGFPMGIVPTGTSPQFSVTGNVMTDVSDEPGSHKLIMKYVTTMTFRTDQEAEIERLRYREQAEKVCALRLKQLRDAFKGATQRSLKVKPLQNVDSIELTYFPTPDLSVYTQRHVLGSCKGYYRYTVVYRVE